MDYTGAILGFGVWAVGVWLTYTLARRAMRSPPPHGMLHPKVPQFVAIMWTAMAAVLLVPVGYFVLWYYEFLHNRS